MRSRWFNAAALAFALFWGCILLIATPAGAQPGSELRFCLNKEPKTFDPLLVEDDASETIRYLTGGVLVRLNRQTQQLEPELATAWAVNRSSTTIRFTLRPNLRFSDGTPFTAEDVAFTIERLMDPALHSPTGDSFRSGHGNVSAEISGKYQIVIVFPAPIVGLDKLFDQVAILSAHSPQKEKAVLGPYALAEYKAGTYVLLKRNPNYWRRDAAGRPLPYIESVRLQIEQNPDIEMLRLMRGEIDFINALNPEYYDRLKTQSQQQASAIAIDAGVSLDSEQMWFNQVPAAPLPAYKKAWFVSTNFRRAISESIDRADLARIVFRGHARPAVSWISPANKFWFNAKLAPHPFDPGDALRLLAQDGFRLQNGTLRDRDGHAVEFSLITNAGNSYRERMAAMIQQDLAAIGIRLNVVTLDFPSLLERITRSFNYEACLLGLVNDDLDPNAQMNVWLSSAENHQWNPNEKTPATAWEAEIDHLMRAQAAEMDIARRKHSVDRVQEIVWQQEPFIYLVNKDAMAAVSKDLQNTMPVALRPQVYWNIDELWISNTGEEAVNAEQAETDGAPLLLLHISASYPGKPNVLSDINLELRRGEVLGLVGESGCGKSTLSLAILKLLYLKRGRAHGSIRLNGHELMTASEREMRSLRGREIALVLQSPLAALNPALRIGAQLEEAWKIHRGKAQCEQAIQQTMENVSLPADAGFLRRYPAELSVGQAQRVLIGMAILHRPALLIADEPTSALDIITQSEILQLFSALSRKLGIGILYISHDLLSVATLCQRVAVMDRGEIVECRATAELFRQPQHEYTRRLIAALPVTPRFEAEAVA